jgi:hypothetical protein
MGESMGVAERPISSALLRLRASYSPPCNGMVAAGAQISGSTNRMTRAPTSRSHRCGAPTEDSPRRQSWVPRPEEGPAPAGRQTREISFHGKDGSREGAKPRRREWRWAPCWATTDLLAALRLICFVFWGVGFWRRERILADVWGEGICRPCRGWVVMGGWNPALTRWAIV